MLSAKIFIHTSKHFKKRQLQLIMIKLRIAYQNCCCLTSCWSTICYSPKQTRAQTRITTIPTRIHGHEVQTTEVHSSEPNARKKTTYWFSFHLRPHSDGGQLEVHYGWIIISQRLLSESEPGGVRERMIETRQAADPLTSHLSEKQQVMSVFRATQQRFERGSTDGL